MTSIVFVWILPPFLVFQVLRPCRSCGQEEGNYIWVIPPQRADDNGWFCQLSTLKSRWVLLEEKKWKLNILLLYLTAIIIRVFCPRAGPSLQAQEPIPQFCRRQVIHRRLRNQGCTFTRDWIGAVVSRCFPQYLAI